MGTAVVEYITPEFVVFATPARSCRGGDRSASVSGRTSRQCLPCHTRHQSAYLEDRGINRSPLSGFLEMAQNPNGEPYPAFPSDKSWNEALAIYMAQGTLLELTVQQIISCDKSDEGCQKRDLPTTFDYVWNTAGGIDSDSDYPQMINVRDRTGHCKWDGNQVASVTSWKYAVPPCTATINTKQPSQQL